MMKIDKEGNKIYHNKYGQLHREDGPALECIDGDKYWWYKDRKSVV